MLDISSCNETPVLFMSSQKLPAAHPSISVLQLLLSLLFAVQLFVGPSLSPSVIDG